MIITVDCGTTNMRCRLFDNGVIIGETKKTAGCRNTAFTGKDDFLRLSLHGCIHELINNSGIAEDDVEAVICAGTLSSDVGIYRVPHVRCPAGIDDTAKAAKLVNIPEITNIPLLFIPGVKTVPDDSERDEKKIISVLESMSGEECETYGIMKQLGLKGDFVITLPGSYNKAFTVDENGRIDHIVTGMCGEFIAAMSEHTLLKKSLPSPVIRNIIPEKLFFGFDFAREYGLSPALIKTRMSRFLYTWSEDEAANYFVGVILLDDIRSTYRLAEGKKLIIGGSDPLRRIFALLLEHYGHDNFVEIDDSVAKYATNLGAIEVYNRFKANT